MLNKLNHAKKYLIYAIFTNILFGLIYYFVFSWLIRYSLLHAYLGCLTLIFVGLWLDKYLLKTLTSQKTIMEIKNLNAKDKAKNYRYIQLLLDSFVSFKTILFVFYFFILVASQVLTIDPSLANDNISNFINANSYGIVLLLALDQIIVQFSKDREESREKLALFESNMNESDCTSSANDEGKEG